MRTPTQALEAMRSVLRHVAGASSLGLLGLFLSRQVLPKEWLRASNDVVGNYLQTLGSIYAVLLAFVVYVVWNQFNEARALVHREANEVLDLYRTVEALHGPEHCGVRDRLRSYAEAVVEHEWDAMAQRETLNESVGGALLQETWEALHTFEPTTAREIALFDEALKRLNDLSDVRSMRLTSAQLRIPFALQLLLYLGAVFLVGSLWLFAVDNGWIHAAITVAMAGAVSHVLYVVDDLDRCFSGDWRVSPQPFLRVLKAMKPLRSTPDFQGKSVVSGS